MMEPLVSIHMITYNHAPYIGKAIEGVLAQKTTFPIELVIGEDCSTDGTREIVFEYQGRYPDLIRLIISESNIGAMQNNARTFAACVGKYVALCEGDDYWTDPHKLQKQVTFLEANPAYAICGHRVKAIDERKPGYSEIIPVRLARNTYSIYDLLRYNFLHTPTIVLRSGRYLVNWPAGWEKVRVGDWMICILAASQLGDIYLMPDLMAVYRIHEGGIHSTKSRKYKVEVAIDLFEVLQENLPSRYEQKIKSKLEHLYISMLGHAIRQGKTAEIRDQLSKIKSLHRSGAAYFCALIKAFFILFFKAMQFYKKR